MPIRPVPWNPRRDAYPGEWIAERRSDGEIVAHAPTGKELRDRFELLSCCRYDDVVFMRVPGPGEALHMGWISL